LLSKERLSALIQLTGSSECAINLHQETLRLGAALMHVIATVEIAFRNAVCDCLEQHFNTPQWLRQPPHPFAWKDTEQKKVNLAVDSAQRAEYSKLSQSKKAALEVLAFPSGRPQNLSHLKRAKARRQFINVTHGKVVAELTLHFWKRLFGPEYEQSLWRTALKRTFPDKRLTRAEVAIQLEHIYQSRNRLAHHEPVLHARFDDTINAIIFATIHSANQSTIYITNITSRINHQNNQQVIGTTKRATIFTTI
jgi:hypothetical protein